MTGEELEKAFVNTTISMIDTCRRKNADYAGQSRDAFANLIMIENLTNGAISTESGVLTRMSDKFARLANLLTSGRDTSVVDESIDDTLLDLANYCILLRIYRQTGEPRT